MLTLSSLFTLIINYLFFQKFQHINEHSVFFYGLTIYSTSNFNKSSFFLIKPKRKSLNVPFSIIVCLAAESLTFSFVSRSEVCIIFLLVSEYNVGWNGTSNHGISSDTYSFQEIRDVSLCINFYYKPIFFGKKKLC